MATSRSDDTITGVYIDTNGDAMMQKANGNGTFIGLKECTGVMNGTDRATIFHGNNQKTWFIFANENMQSI